MEFKQYEDKPGFTLQPKRMSDAVLAEMLSARPVVNADVIFYNKTTRTVYLPTRKSKPADGLWVIGGAMKAGEHPVDTLVRRVTAETGLMIPRERFEFLTLISFVWSYRKEEPTTDGRHDINFIYALELNEEELAAAARHLDPNEYEEAQGLRAFASLSELEAAGARENILDYYQLLFPA